MYAVLLIIAVICFIIPQNSAGLQQQSTGVPLVLDATSSYPSS